MMKSLLQAVLLVAPGLVFANPPVILGMSGNQLDWTNSQPGLFSQIEISTNLAGGLWNPVAYDFASTGTLTTPVPDSSAPAAYYRVAVVTNVPDPGLQVHLTFDNDFPHGSAILDSSGYGRDALHYGRPSYPTNWGFPTNWPTQINGKIGKAAQFQYYYDGWDPSDLGRSGDYAAITNLGPLLQATQMTISAWCYYYTAVSNSIGNDQVATILSAGYNSVGTWDLGREYSMNTCFTITTPTGAWNMPNLPGQPYGYGWPEDYRGSIGNSGGWHFYAVTIDCSSGNAVVKGYFQGTNFTSGTAANVPFLTVQTPLYGPTTNRFPWVAVGCQTHNGTAPMESGDHYPNSGWLNGALDDVRIYNRILPSGEIYSLYTNGLAGKSQ